MHSVLLEATRDLGIENEIPCLAEAADLSDRILGDARGHLRHVLDPEGVPLDVLVMGSVARGEATRGSDFDCLVIAHGLPDKVGLTRELLNATDKVRDDLGLEPAGRSGIFQTVASAPDLTERIGLEQDTNVTHTRRVLLLQESASIYQPDLREVLLKATLDRYLSFRKVPKPGVPRFLLNDILRYWTTIAVDYQAKRWEKYGQPGWGLRFLKLIVSRKIAYAGTLVSLLNCRSATVDYFFAQFDMPPLARLAQVQSQLCDPGRDALRTVIQIREEFEKALASGLREEADAISSASQVVPGSRFDQMRKRSDDLQGALERIFFDSDLLGANAKKYLSF